MTLDHPYPVYGRVRDSTGYLAGLTVNAEDVTTPGGTITAETGADGEYFVDISSVTDSNGDTIKISATYLTRSDDRSFVLDLTGPAKEINLYLTEPGAYIVQIGWVVAE